MNWLRAHQRTAWICGLTLLLPVLLYLDALLGLWNLRQDSQAEIDRMQPRIARMQGLIDYEDQLREAATRLDSQVLNLVYPATEDQAEVASALQKNIREIVTEAGLSVTNSQALRAREQEDFDYIGIKLTVSGDLAALDEALAGIASHLPLVLVETLDIFVKRGGRKKDAPEQQLVTASLLLLSLRSAQ